jgi:hypothetical protein
VVIKTSHHEPPPGAIAKLIPLLVERELQSLLTDSLLEERHMKYGIAWLLGVPGSLILLWFVASQMGCGV